MNELTKLFDQFSNNYVGFDQIRKHFANIEAATRIPSFPPLNIYREHLDEATLQVSGDYVFELALSGYKPTDVPIPSRHDRRNKGPLGSDSRPSVNSFPHADPLLQRRAASPNLDSPRPFQNTEVDSPGNCQPS